MAKTTQKELEALGPQHDGSKLYEDGSLIGTVRAGAKGVAVYWAWRYGFEGKTKEITVGVWPRQSMPIIRKLRDGYASDLASGADPAVKKAASKATRAAESLESARQAQERLQVVKALSSRMTVQQLYNLWEAEDLAHAHKDKGLGVRQLMARNALPDLGALAAEDVARRHVDAVVSKLKRTGKQRLTVRVFSLIRQMFRWAVYKDILKADPTAAISKAKEFGKAPRRKRFLSELEIRQLVKVLPASKLPERTQVGLWLQLATCCRIGELMKAKWAEIDLEGRTWTIPSGNAKNKEELTVYLSDFAAERFATLRTLAEKSAFVMPSRDGKTAQDEKNITKLVASRQCGEDKKFKKRTPLVNALTLTGGKWTPHDLRRTGATLMGGLGVSSDVIERCLNHKEQNDMKATYQQYDQAREMRLAWAKLGERLTALVSEGTAAAVVPLAARRAKKSA